MKTTESGGPSGYDAGKKVKGRKRHLVVDVEGLPLGLAVHAASVQDRDGAPAVIFGVLEKAPHIRKIWADGGFRGGKLASRHELGLGIDLEIVKKPKDVKGFTVLQRRWVVERPSLGCRAADVWRRTTSGAWRALWRGRSWPRAG